MPGWTSATSTTMRTRSSRRSTTTCCTRTGGKLDLLVITHRHLDHMEGFFSLRKRFKADFTIQRLWHAHVTPSLDHVFEIAERSLRTMLPASIPDERHRHRAGVPEQLRRERRQDPQADGGHPEGDRGAGLAHLQDPSGTQPEAGASAGAEASSTSKSSVPEKNSKRYLQPLEHALRARGIAIVRRQRPDQGDAGRIRSTARGR